MKVHIGLLGFLLFQANLASGVEIKELEAGFESIFDGTLISEVRDDDPEKRRMNRLLGVQVHVGPPMKIEFRSIRVKRFK